MIDGITLIKGLFYFMLKAKSLQTYEKHCIMLGVDEPEFLKSFSDLQKQILPADIYDNDKNEFGLEVNPHVTILYGLTESNDMVTIDKYFATCLPLEIKIGNLSLFETDDYDVLKFDIISNDLKKLNKYLRDNFNYQNDYPNYKPHLTIAYLVKGTGKNYLKLANSQKGNNIICDTIEYSLANGTKWTTKAGRLV